MTKDQSASRYSTAEQRITVGGQSFMKGSGATWYATLNERGGIAERVEEHIWPLLDEIAKLRAAAVSELRTRDEELKRLREIEHLAWHMMDDSEENARTGKITIRPMREDYDRLSELLPEGHPGEDDEAPPPKQFHCEEKLGDRCATQCSVCAEGSKRYER